jgi:hypothetical protein
VSVLPSAGVFLLRIIFIIRGEKRIRAEFFLALGILLLMMLLAPSWSNGLMLWNAMQATASYIFFTASLIGGPHHHAHAWHDGSNGSKEDHNDRTANVYSKRSKSAIASKRAERLDEYKNIHAAAPSRGVTVSKEQQQKQQQKQQKQKQKQEFSAVISSLAASGALTDEEVDHLHTEGRGASAVEIQGMTSRLRELLGEAQDSGDGAAAAPSAPDGAAGAAGTAKAAAPSGVYLGIPACTGAAVAPLVDFGERQVGSPSDPPLPPPSSSSPPPALPLLPPFSLTSMLFRLQPGCFCDGKGGCQCESTQPVDDVRRSFPAPSLPYCRPQVLLLLLLAAFAAAFAAVAAAFAAAAFAAAFAAAAFAAAVAAAACRFLAYR